MKIDANRIELTLETVEDALGRIDALAPADRKQLSDQWLARLQSATAPDPWVHGFTITRRDDGEVVGQCGFKGPPDSSGVVEIDAADVPLVARNLSVIALFSQRFDTLVEQSESPDDSALRIAAAVLNLLKPYVHTGAAGELDELATHYARK